jgi:hypothetical protein
MHTKHAYQACKKAASPKKARTDCLPTAHALPEILFSLGTVITDAITDAACLGKSPAIQGKWL